MKLAACATVPHWRRRLYVLAAYTGLRQGEIRALEWSDVHEDEGFIHVHVAIDAGTGDLQTPKTQASVRK